MGSSERRRSNRKSSEPEYLGDEYLSQYIVTDPQVAGGRPVFRGTDILVDEFLERFKVDMSDEDLIAAFGGRITKEQVSAAIIWRINEVYADGLDEAELAFLEFGRRQMAKILEDEPWEAKETHED